MGMMIVRHKVRDYGQWRPIFDRAEMRTWILAQAIVGSGLSGFGTKI